MTAAAKNPFLHISLAFLYFLLSAIITGWFIIRGTDLYNFDLRQMILSGSIAGGKWAIQIFAAMAFLKEERWLFIRHLGFICFAGSCMLLPFCLIPAMSGAYGFIGSLVASVLLMLIIYPYYVRKDGLSIKWYFLWVICLSFAIAMQLTVVFNVIA